MGNNIAKKEENIFLSFRLIKKKIEFKIKKITICIDKDILRYEVIC
jgi:hypothetical protein